MAVELKREGLHLTGTPLWLDATRKRELAFCSHAHSDHVGRHERVIATAATLKLMAHRLKRPVPAPLPAPYGRPFDLGKLVLELLPAGHVLGSAQLRAIREDGRRVVYTGDLNAAPSLTAEPLQVAECDTLVIESTFGHPRYRFPARAGVLADIAAWCAAQLQRGVTPVLLAYPLGKSQEAIRFLQGEGFKLRAHASIHALCALYGELGVPLAVERFDAAAEPGEVLVFPPNLARARALSELGPHATALLSGWALDGVGAQRRAGADTAFPLSDHADFQMLVDYVEATGAGEVITHHGFARELAEALRARGVDARALGTREQLDLFAGSPRKTG